MNAAACLLVCDLSLENIFTDIKQWYEEVSRKVLLNSGKRVPTILVCNKIDLPQVQAKYSNQQIQQRLQEIGFDAIMQTSAKTGNGIDQLLEKLSDVVVNSQKEATVQVQNMKTADHLLIVDEKKKGCC